MRVENRTGTLEIAGLKENKPEYIIIHSTYNHPEFENVLRCHKDKGWNGAGYHLFVSNSNKVSQGRPFDKEGAHAWGFNTKSIGLCFHQNGKIDSKIGIVRELISDLKNEYKSIEVIPHTLAQVIYNNKLLKEAGIDRQFPETIDVVNEKLFHEIKSETDRLVGTLSTSDSLNLKQALKDFKNCPGESFYRFI